MRRFLVVGALAAGVATLSAQAIADLSGTWIADASKSDTATPDVGRGRGGDPNQLVITKTATELTVSQGGTGNYIYNLDGSERTGPPGGETKSRIAWEGGKLIVTWKREYFAGPDNRWSCRRGRRRLERRCITRLLEPHIAT
jgi:hypothetical protein